MMVSHDLPGNLWGMYSCFKAILAKPIFSLALTAMDPMDVPKKDKF